MIFFFCNSDSARHFKVKDPNPHFHFSNTFAGEKKLSVHKNQFQLDYTYA